MPAPRSLARLGVLGCACAALIGCQRSPLVPAEGQVLLDGQPLAKATVTLLPEAGGKPAAAFSREDGGFALRTGNDLGALPGHYKVLIAKDEPGEPAAEAPSAQPNSPEDAHLIGEATPEELGAGMQKLTRFPVRSVIPERYASPVTSPLECDVKPAGVHDLRFELSTAK